MNISVRNIFLKYRVLYAMMPRLFSIYMNKKCNLRIMAMAIRPSQDWNAESEYQQKKVKK